MSRRRSAGLALLLLASVAARAQGDSGPVYRCPGNPESYTNMLTPQQAKDRGCRTIEGSPITIVQTRRPTPAPPAPASGARPADSRIDPAEQRARDSDARRILQDELQREEQRLAELRKEYNDGQPERRGDERNYQKYLDRTASLKAQIERKEQDVAAIRRELAKVAP
jgi:hypothetical protein